MFCRPYISASYAVGRGSALYYSLDLVILFSKALGIVVHNKKSYSIQMKIPHLIAHRGYAKHYPENTLVALEAALQAGACYIEFDVQLTADGVPVVYHDDTLQRTTGIDQRLLSMTTEQLKGVYANETARLGDKFTDVAIPTLAEAVALLKKWPHATAFVEIKEESLKAFGIENAVKAVLKVLQPVLDQCVLISFDRLALRCARAMQEVRVGWVMHQWDNATRGAATALAPNYLFCNYKKIPADDVLWIGPWQWALYEVTNPEVALLLAARGASLIETMAIGEMLRYPPLRKQGCFGQLVLNDKPL